MKHKILITVALFTLIACSCGKQEKQIESPLSMINSNGDIIELYMPRDEAIKILGDGELQSIGTYNYGSITVGFTQDVVSYMVSMDNGDWRLADDNRLGAAMKNADTYTSYPLSSGTLYLKHYQNNDDKYTLISNDDIPKPLTSDSYKKYQGVEINTRDDKVDVISVFDSYVSQFVVFDKELPATDVVPENSKSPGTASELPDSNGLSSKLANVMSDLHILTIPDNIAFANQSLDGNDMYLDITMTTDICDLIFHCAYYDSTSHWLIYLVENAKNEHTYWVPKGQENYIDLYDYSTDELISMRSETFGDIGAELESRFEEINEQTDDKLKAILDEYGID